MYPLWKWWSLTQILMRINIIIQYFIQTFLYYDKVNNYLWHSMWFVRSSSIINRYSNNLWFLLFFKSKYFSSFSVHSSIFAIQQNSPTFRKMDLVRMLIYCWLTAIKLQAVFLLLQVNHVFLKSKYHYLLD